MLPPATPRYPPPVPTPVPRRKGYPSRGSIPSSVLHRLNHAEEPTITLSEWLAVDLSILCATVLSELGHPKVGSSCAALASQLAGDGVGIMERLRRLGQHIYQEVPSRRRDSLVRALASHDADIPRQLAALTIPHRGLDLVATLEAVRPFAADAHMGVREIAWMVLRPALVTDLSSALRMLHGWGADADANVRRCAIESTRPRGVWCAHIESLKHTPAQAESLLDLVKSDPSRYVQNSVANWLNDASKSDVAWVKRVVDRWTKESKSAETAYIVRRALRTASKNSVKRPRGRSRSK